MRSGYLHFSNGKNKVGTGKVPSLVDLCVQTAIDNIRYIGNVGPTDSHLLERILPHCSVEQLMHIENVTVDRDLSSVTDKLWKKFYEKQFGAKNVELVVQRMAKKKATFNWRQLYQAKLKLQDEAQKISLERLAQSFKNENARKQSRQIQICAKVPPSSKKRTFGGFGGSSSFSNVKSSIMKKAKVEYFNSAEVKNRAAIRKIGASQQRSYSAEVTNRAAIQKIRAPQQRSNSAEVTNRATIRKLGAPQQRSNSAEVTNRAAIRKIGAPQQRSNSILGRQIARGKGIGK